MEKTFAQIDQQKKQLAQNPFCLWLKQAGLDQDALIFAPSMSYFVLGFRDILELAKRPNPTTELDFSINIHCEEDKEHWKWFLGDIQKLGYLNMSPEDFIFRIWSDEERVPRNMIHFVTHLVQSQSDSRLLLTIIECLEAAFAVFIEQLKPQLIQRNVYTKLSYFGEKHDLGEQSHAMGSWVDEGGVDAPPHSEMSFLQDTMPAPLQAQADELIVSIFVRFQELFSHWHQIALNGNKAIDPQATLEMSPVA